MNMNKGAIAALLIALAGAMPAHAANPASRAATTTYHFDHIPVRSALQLLAEEGQFNLVVSDSVQGTIDLHLEDVTWEQVLAIVLRLKGLEQHVDGSTRSVTVSGA